MSDKVKVLNNDLVVRLMEEKYGSEGISRWKNEMDWEGVHIVGMNFLHNDSDIRFMALIAVKDQYLPREELFDLPVSEFNHLPEITVEGVS